MHHNSNFHQDFFPFQNPAHFSLLYIISTGHWLHWRTLDCTGGQSQWISYIWPSCLWLRTGTSSSWRWRRQPHCRNSPNPNLRSCQEVFNCLGWTFYCGGRGLTIYSVPCLAEDDHHRNVQPVFELSPGEDHEKVRNHHYQVPFI